MAAGADVDPDDPHRDAEVASAGVPLEEAALAVIMLHGRGATATGILDFATEFDVEGVAYLAPQAARRTWYPNSFLAPIEDNEPWLSSALQLVGTVRADIEAGGVPVEQTVLLGFSQGACLASEYVARNAQRYGGLAALSGGLIGPPGTPRDYGGDLGGMPAFIGCGDQDPHIPVERVTETTQVLTDLGGDVDERIYEGMGHGIIPDEIEAVTGMLRQVTR